METKHLFELILLLRILTSQIENNRASASDLFKILNGLQKKYSINFYVLLLVYDCTR